MGISYERLWRLLERKRLNRADLQKYAGISASTVSKLMHNETVNMNVLIRICEALGCDIGDIVGIDRKR